MNDSMHLKCNKATDDFLDHSWKCQRLLADIATNGAGILHSPSEARRNVLAARKELDDALSILNETTWPSEEDYDD